MLRNITRRSLLVILLLTLIQLNEALHEACVKTLTSQIGVRNCSADNCYLCTVSNVDDYSGIPTDANALRLFFSSEAGLELSSRLPLLSQLHGIDFSVSNLGQSPTIPNGYFWGCTDLRVLTFYRQTTSHVAVRLVNGSFTGLSNLTKLTAGGVGIRELPVGVFTDLQSLKILDLSRNRITMIENGTFDRQRQLNTLFLGENAISSLANVSFDGLDSLRVIDLYRNEIRILGADMRFAALPNLTELNLGSNGMLRVDPYAFTGLRRLKKLFLDGNSLSAIKVNVFSDLSQLIELDLSRNHLKNLSNGSFFHLNSLETLILTANRLETIVSGTFYGLTNLKTLDLRSNLIKTVEEKGFDGLESLTDLELSDNLMNALIFSDFLFLPSLENLDLRNNRLETLSLRATDNIEQLSLLLHVDLSQNSWNCDCDIYWIVLLLNQRNLTNSIANSGSITCNAPSHLRNVSIFSAFANHSCPFPFRSKQLATPTTKLYTPVPTPTPKPYIPVPTPKPSTPVPTPTPKPSNPANAAMSNEYNKAEPSRNREIVVIVVPAVVVVLVAASIFVVFTWRRRYGFWDRRRSESIVMSRREKEISRYTLHEELTTPIPEITPPNGSYDNPLTTKDSEIKIITCTGP